MNIRNNPKTASLLLAGLATGAAAWYLFGTENGRRTCNQLADSIKDMSGSVMNKANETISNLKSKKEDYTS